MEQASNTPDFVSFEPSDDVAVCLDMTIQARDAWA
jgi:hypothetical protein